MLLTFSLCSKFVLSLPPAAMTDPIRVLFAIQNAFWQYTDHMQCVRRRCTAMPIARLITLVCTRSKEATLPRIRSFPSFAMQSAHTPA
jgi:hypothetical protein